MRSEGATSEENGVASEGWCGDLRCSGIDVFIVLLGHLNAKCSPKCNRFAFTYSPTSVHYRFISRV